MKKLLTLGLLLLSSLAFAQDYFGDVVVLNSIDVQGTTIKLTGVPGSSGQIASRDGSNNMVFINAPKRVETYSGTSNSSGNVTITFSAAFPTAPICSPVIPNQGSNFMYAKTTSSSTTGCVINIYSTSVLAGILGTAPVNAQAVDVIVVQK